MTARYSDTEIVDIARQIERCGEAFYEQALPHLNNQKAREVFAWLRDEEAKHAATFERLLAGVELAAGEWRHAEEYLGYLHALVDTRVFPDPADAAAAVAQLHDDAAAIRYAIGFEKDSILFFHELGRMVGEADRALVEQLVAEERRHLLTLDGLLREVVASAA